MPIVIRCVVSLLVLALPLSLHAKEYGLPLVATLNLVPENASAGQEVELHLTLKVNDPWHVFADTSGSAGQQKLDFDTDCPRGVEVVGDWEWPQYRTVFEGRTVHVYEAGTHHFKRKIRVMDASSSPLSISVKMTWQACNPEFCGPVQIETLSAELRVGASSASAPRAVNPAPPVKDISGASMPAEGSPIAGTPLAMKFTALDGRVVDIEKMLGHVVLIDFWATWCVPCVAELPTIKAVYEKYRERGFEVIGVTFDQIESRQELLKFIRKKDLSWPQRFDGKAFDVAAQRLYGLKGIPATFLIDKRGHLVGTNLRGEALEPAVEHFLAESPPRR